LLTLQDGGCPFFEWQDKYADNLDGYLQNASQASQHPQQHQIIQALPVIGEGPLGAPATVKVLQGHPISCAAPAPQAPGASGTMAPSHPSEDQKPSVDEQAGPVHRRKINCACQAPPASVSTAARAPDMVLLSLFLSAINLLATVFVLGVVLVMMVGSSK
jgi:hypothetical protein